MNYYNYFTEIEETFVRRRGKNLMLSPLDWALIESWQEREVPLHIVLRAIEKVFDTVDRQPARKRSVKSLFYCKEEIEAQYAEWLEMQVGKNGDGKTPDSESENREAGVEPQNSMEAKDELFSDHTIENHLAEARAALEAATESTDGDLREALGRVRQRLAEIGKNYETAEKLEASLESLDALIDESLLAAARTEAAKKEIEKQLRTYQGKMDKEVFERTVQLMLLKKLREDAKIPRLSLFYL